MKTNSLKWIAETRSVYTEIKMAQLKEGKKSVSISRLIHLDQETKFLNDWKAGRDRKWARIVSCSHSLAEWMDYEN